MYWVIYPPWLFKMTCLRHSRWVSRQTSIQFTSDLTQDSTPGLIDFPILQVTSLVHSLPWSFIHFILIYLVSFFPPAGSTLLFFLFMCNHTWYITPRNIMPKQGPSYWDKLTQLQGLKVIKNFAFHRFEFLRVKKKVTFFFE